MLQEARAFQKSTGFAPYRQLRQVAEHRLARLMQLNVRQARYFGRVKTRLQHLLAATVANLALVATNIGLMPDRSRRKAHPAAHLLDFVILLPATCRLFVAQHPGPKRWASAQR